jgi:hypothetical protein
VTLPAVIEQAIEKAQRHADSTKAEALALIDVARDLEECPVECDVYFTGGDNIGVFTAHPDAMIRYLSDKGYVLRGEPEKSPHDGWGAISWRFRRGSVDPERTVIRLTKLIGEHHPSPENGQHCRLVRTGTKTIEQPVYEIQCQEPEGATS